MENNSSNVNVTDKSVRYGKKKSVGSVIKKIVAFLVAVAVVFGCAYYFGIPQKTLKCVTVDGKSYSMAEYSFYYMSVWMTYYNYSSQYGASAVNGFDGTISPELQSTKDEDGKTITFAQFFQKAAIENMANVKRIYGAAVEAGTQLTDDDKKTIDETMAQFDQYLGSYSLSSYLSKRYGKGISEKVFEKIVTEQTMVTRYQESVKENFENEVTKDDVNKIYNADPKAYDVVDFRWYTIDYEDGKVEAAEATADQFIASVKNDGNTVDAFKKNAVKYLDPNDPEYKNNLDTFAKDAATALYKMDAERVKSGVGDEAVNWLYAKDSKGAYTVSEGEMKRFTGEKAVYILYALGAPYADSVKPVSLRHVLFSFPETTDGASVTEEQKKEVKAKAEAALETYKGKIEEGKTFNEDAFAALAADQSEDTGSKENGGLIEGMVNDNKYVQNFEDWAFCEGAFKNEKRSEGDTAIVETEYGYHLMYFISVDENPAWYTSIVDGIVSEKTEKFWADFDKKFEVSEDTTDNVEPVTVSEEDVTAEYKLELPTGVSVSEFLVKLATNSSNKIIESTIAR